MLRCWYVSYPDTIDHQHHITADCRRGNSERARRQSGCQFRFTKPCGPKLGVSRLRGGGSLLRNWKMTRKWSAINAELENAMQTPPTSQHFKSTLLFSTQRDCWLFSSILQRWTFMPQPISQVKMAKSAKFPAGQVGVVGLRASLCHQSNLTSLG